MNATDTAAQLHATCDLCAIMPAGRCCLSHTCLDCGQPTATGHNDGPCPA